MKLYVGTSFICQGCEFFAELDNIVLNSKDISISCPIYSVILDTLLSLAWIFNNFLNLQISKVIIPVLICSICQFPRYKYSQYGQFQITSVTSLNMVLRKDVEQPTLASVFPYLHTDTTVE